MERLFATYNSSEKIKDSIHNPFKCCNTPFTTCSINTGITECRFCKKKYKEQYVLVYRCEECKIKEVEIYKTVNIIKDNHKNWTICDKCNKYIQYTRKQKIEFIL